VDGRKLKIAVYAISKNEEQFVERFCTSAKGADLILIADTGSTDGTVEKARGFGAFVPEICITPWRFDLARNAALALIPRDIDICISLDLDEELQPGWREEIERVWVPGTTRLRYFFDWGCGIKFKYEKIHARHGYRWHHPCHEYPVPDTRIKEVWADTDMLVAIHKPDPTKSRGQYLDLLKVSVDEDPRCPRNAFYYARELSFHQKWPEAIEALNRYLKMPEATWPNERCYAMRTMGRVYNELNNTAEAEKWFNLAAAEAPNTREPWCELALLLYREHRWAECFAASMRALQIKNREMVYTCDPAVWGHWAHDLASISAWNMGMMGVALEQAELAVQASPDDERLINNLAAIRKSIDDKALLAGIPNIVHFMYFFGPNSREFSYINYLAVKTAHEVQKPDAIYFYYNTEPENNPYWERMKPMVRLIQMEPPTEYKGVSLRGYPQYQADVVRLQKLYEHGGIYLDTDALMMKPFYDLMTHECILTGRLDDLTVTEKNDQEFITNGVIISKPRARFLKVWLDNLDEGLKNPEWAWHAVNLPVLLYKKNQNLAKVIGYEKFLPFNFYEYDVLDPNKGEEQYDKYKDSYIWHMWETIWRPQLETINEANLASNISAFGKAFGKYASP
jgi:glycosyltransferase involved in cell wall biosynthesis